MILYGFGDHGSVVYDCLRTNQPFAGYFDQVVQTRGADYLGPYDPTILAEDLIVISIGNNRIRKTVVEMVQHRFGTVVAPSAVVSKNALIGMGATVLQGAIVQSGASIGKHVIVNAGAIVDHGSKIGDFVHLAQGAIICGNCEIGEGTLIGAGAIIHTGVRIGSWQSIAPGELVTANRL